MVEDEDDSMKDRQHLYSEVDYSDEWVPVQSQYVPNQSTATRSKPHSKSVDDEDDFFDDDVVCDDEEEELMYELQPGTQNFLDETSPVLLSAEKLHPDRGTQIGRSSTSVPQSQFKSSVRTIEIQGTEDEDYLLETWGVDPLVVQEYRKDGITQLYPWQVGILQLRNVFLGKSNLIYCAPTSGGKTLVCEILMLKRLTAPQNRSKKAFFIVPFISIVEEKVEQLQKRFRSTGLKIGAYFSNTGGSIRTREFTDTNIIVCTIEKGNSMIHQLIAAERADEISMIIIDECHMIGDKHRGYQLESMLTKLVYLNSTAQVIGMSATLPNLDQLASWLNAELFITNFRPVPLKEYVVLGDKIFDGKTKTLVRTLAPFPGLSQINGNRQLEILSRSLTGRIGHDLGVTQLCFEMLQESKSVLIFCKSRYECSKWALLIAGILAFNKNNSSQETADQRQMMISALERTQTGLDPELEVSIRQGVAFHHAGLTKSEREIVERGYRDGSIQVLTCTTTLSAGVNLPAKRVIFASLQIAQDVIDIIRYRQSAGRAGRAGLDASGESFIIASPKERDLAYQLVNDPMPELVSSLSETKRCMPKCLLEAFDGELVKSGEDIGRFASCTLYKRQVSLDVIRKQTTRHLQFLLKHRFVEYERQTKSYCVTPLGRAANGSGFTPEETLFMKIELDKAQNQLILQDDLHIVYHLTPFNHNLQVKWSLFVDLFRKLTGVQKRIAKAIGLQEEYLFSKMHGREHSGYPSTDLPLYHLTLEESREHLESNQEIIQMRFFAAMVLRDLIEEEPLSDIAQKYNLHRGQLQALQESAATFSGMVMGFCTALKWKHLKSLFSCLRHRLNFGVKGELVSLCSIPHVKAFIARALFKGGFKTVHSVAAASPDQIYKCLKEYIPFRGSSNGNVEIGRHYSSLEKVEQRRAKLIVDGAIKAVQTGAILVYDEDDEEGYEYENSRSLLITPPRSSMAVSFNSSPKKFTRSPQKFKPSQMPIPSKIDQNKPIPKFTPIPRRPALATLSHNVNTSFKAVPSQLTLSTAKVEQKISVKPDTPPVTTESAKRKREEELPSIEQPISKKPKPTHNNHYNHSYKINLINPSNESRLQALLSQWSSQDNYAFNVIYKSSSGVNNDERVKPIHTVTGISVCWPSQKKDGFGKCIVEVVHHLLVTNPIILQRYVKPILEQKGPKKTAVDMKLAYRILAENGVVLPVEGLRDVIVADHLIKPSEEETQTEKRQTLSQAWSQLISTTKQLLDADNRKDIADSETADSCQTAIHCFRLMVEQEKHMQMHELWDCFERLEMPLVPVLAKLESDGVRFIGKDNGPKSLINHWLGLVLDKQDKIQQEVQEFIKRKLGRDYPMDLIDLRNRDKVESLLYDVMKLKVNIKSGKSGKRPTKKDALKKMALEYPDAPIEQIILFRSLENLVTKQLDSFAREHVVLDRKTGMRKVYARQLNTASVTGRLAVTAPNLQNVPHDVSFAHPCPNSDMIRKSMMETGRMPMCTISIRSAFVPRCPEMYILLSADYQQIELRMIAYLSQDQQLLDLLKDPLVDPFKRMACHMFSCENESVVTSDQRAIVKQLWYATIYGMGLHTLSEKLRQVLNADANNSSFHGATRLQKTVNDDRQLAKNYSHQFSQRFPVMDKYRTQYVKDQLLEHTHVSTISNRKRVWLDAAEKRKDEGLFGKYCRDALSTIVQGSAADIFKAALINTDKRLYDLNKNCQSDPIASLVLHVHDELVFEVKHDHLPQVAAMVKHEMETAAKYFNKGQMHFPVKLRYGVNWAQLKDYVV